MDVYITIISDGKFDLSLLATSAYITNTSGLHVQFKGKDFFLGLRSSHELPKLEPYVHPTAHLCRISREEHDNLHKIGFFNDDYVRDSVSGRIGRVAFLKDPRTGRVMAA